LAWVVVTVAGRILEGAGFSMQEKQSILLGKRQELTQSQKMKLEEARAAAVQRREKTQREQREQERRRREPGVAESLLGLVGLSLRAPQEYEHGARVEVKLSDGSWGTGKVVGYDFEPPPTYTVELAEGRRVYEIERHEIRRAGTSAYASAEDVPAAALQRAVQGVVSELIKTSATISVGDVRRKVEARLGLGGDMLASRKHEVKQLITAAVQQGAHSASAAGSSDGMAPAARMIDPLPKHIQLHPRLARFQSRLDAALRTGQEPLRDAIAPPTKPRPKGRAGTAGTGASESSLPSSSRSNSGTKRGVGRHKGGAVQV
jgi:hypothetical protein